jgi:hypothetical protein
MDPWIWFIFSIFLVLIAAYFVIGTVIGYGFSASKSPSSRKGSLISGGAGKRRSQ